MPRAAKQADAHWGLGVAIVRVRPPRTRCGRDARVPRARCGRDARVPRARCGRDARVPRQRLDLDAGVVEAGAGANVRQRVRGQGAGVGARLGAAEPHPLGQQGHAGLEVRVEAEAAAHLAVVVEDADPRLVARVEAAGGGVAGVHLERHLAGAQLPEGRADRLRHGRRDERQRVPLRAGRGVEGVEPLARLGVEGRRAQVNFAVAGVGEGIDELDGAAAGSRLDHSLVFESAGPFPAQDRLRPLRCGARVAVAQQAEPVREVAEHPVVGSRLTDRRRNRLRRVKHHRAVAHREVVVLEEARRGQHQVRVAGGVGQNLVEHDREQILAFEAAPHEFLVRQRGERVRVVDEQHLDRRP